MDEKIDKATHKPFRTDLFVPIMKENNGKYIAVLSDDSLDRDDERVSAAALMKIHEEDGYIAALMDHKNSVENIVAEWTNKRIREVDGHVALIAEPKFFLSNPKAQLIKGLLDDGAVVGVSIGAMVKKFEEEEIDGITIRTFTELELLEASFVGIPSNRHSRAMAVAKAFKKNKKTEVSKMDKQFTQKDIDAAIEKKADEMQNDFDDKIKAKQAELEKSDKEITDLKEASKSDSDKSKEALEKANKEAQEKLEAEKKISIEKQQFADQGGKPKEQELSNSEIDKAFEDGKLPIMQM